MAEKKKKSKEKKELNDEDGLFRCDSCSATLKTKRELTRHKDRHNEENYIICPIEGCETRVFKGDRFGHIRALHTFQTQICEICSRTFRNRECLRKHKYKVHHSIKCSGCHKRILKTASHTCTNEFKAKEKEIQETPFCCIQCNKCFKTASILGRHMKNVHRMTYETLNLVCRNCSVVFDDKSELNKHRKICACILCPICSSPFRINVEKNQKIFDAHMAKHAEEKVERNFDCPECSCRFFDNRTLQNHIANRHTNIAPEVTMNFECSLCDAMYRKPILLKLHMESRHQITIDNTEKICVICFENFEDLANHMHSEHKKVFNCGFEGCKKKFRTESSLSSHEMVHDVNYEPDLSCSICLKVFISKKLLSEHFKNHGVEKVRKSKIEGGEGVKKKNKKNQFEFQ